jgi:hypothetical protein
VKTDHLVDWAKSKAWQEKWHREYASRWVPDGDEYTRKLVPAAAQARPTPMRTCRETIQELERELAGP